jgi:hypothetical protein
MGRNNGRGIGAGRVSGGLRKGAKPAGQGTIPDAYSPRNRYKFRLSTSTPIIFRYVKS